MASAPPVTTVSTQPSWMAARAIPMASLLEAQAEARAMPSPRMPCCRPMYPAAAFGISIGTLSGLIRCGPLPSRIASCSTIVVSPPTPVAKSTPMRSRLPSLIVSPDSAMASFAAPTASWQKRSMRRAVRASMWLAGSNPFTSPATCVLSPSSTGSKWVMRAMPDSPATSRGHVAAIEWASGLIDPIPVMTTRRRSTFRSSDMKPASAAPTWLGAATQSSPRRRRVHLGYSLEGAGCPGEGRCSARARGPEAGADRYRRTQCGHCRCTRAPGGPLPCGRLPGGHLWLILALKPSRGTDDGLEEERPAQV